MNWEDILTWAFLASCFILIFAKVRKSWNDDIDRQMKEMRYAGSAVTEKMNSLNEVKKKIEDTLDKHKTPKAIEWFYTAYESRLTSLGIKVEKNVEEGDLTIKRRVKFYDSGVMYELTFSGERYINTPDSGFWAGNFILTIDKNVVFESDYFKYMEYSELGTEVDIRLLNYKTAKLADWVQDLPWSVKGFEGKLDRANIKARVKSEEEEFSRTKDNFDLGKYK
jgi:hypothetical protein